MRLKPLAVLKALADKSRADSPDDKHLQETAALIAEALGAEEAYLLYGADWFRKLGEPGDPQDYDIKQEGYWLLNRFMVEKANPCAFNVADKRVYDIVAARPGVTRSHAAALIPMSEGNAEMLIVGGLRERLRQSDIALLEATAPIVAHLVARQVDAQRWQRQKQQLSALADVARVMARSQEKEQVLAEVATAVAGAGGFDHAAIGVLDPSGKRLAYRVLSLQRYSQHPVSQAYKQGVMDEVIIALANGKEPVLYRDLANDPRFDEQMRYLLSGKGLIASLASFPLVFQGEALGLMSLSSLSPHSLDRAEVELLEGLAAQVAMILKGLDMYEELRSSKEKLQEYARRLEESMSIEHRLARTDALTGIPNRRYLEDAIASECARALSGGGDLCVLMADIDRFKDVNDSFGHPFGDDVLKLVASQSWQACRNGEMAGRYGGDEFLFILPATSVERAVQFAEEFRKDVEKATLYSPPGHAIGVTISIGIAQSDAECLCEPSEIVDRADRAMYRAKLGGRNQVATFELAATTKRSERFENRPY